MAGPVKPFEATKFYDVAAAGPLLAFYGWAVARDWPRLQTGFAALGEGGGWEAAAETAGLALSLIFAGLLIGLVLVRRLPVRKSDGIVPRVVALLGAAGGAAILFLPGARLPLALDVAAVILVFAGMLATLVSFFWLRRSFSVFPEARRLVTTGPYRLVRHPVYLFEEIALFGVILQFAQPWAFLLFAAQFGFQLARMHFEERVLHQAFPEYADYAARTPRLIPGVY